MNDTIIVALVVSLIAPLILLIGSSLIRMSVRKKDYERQDKVAAKALSVATRATSKATETQTQLAAQAAEAVGLLMAFNERALQQYDEANRKLDGIHTLVNTDYTALMEKQLIALKAQRVLLRRFLARDLRDGIESTFEDQQTLQHLDIEIDELSKDLEVRAKQIVFAEKQMAQAREESAIYRAEMRQGIQKIADTLDSAHERAEAVDSDAPPGEAADAASKREEKD